jgi:hypothetical protein
MLTAVSEKPTILAVGEIQRFASPDFALKIERCEAEDESAGAWHPKSARAGRITSWTFVLRIEILLQRAIVN